MSELAKATTKTESKCNPKHRVSDTARLDVFPAFHKVAGRTVLIVGGGEEAAAKIRLLSQTTAEIRTVATEFGPEVLAAARANANVRKVSRAFQKSDLENTILVFAATGEADEDRAIVEAAKAAGIPANAVDRPELCDFFTPALVNRAPVAVAVTSTGVGPVLARHIRAQIEGMLPLETGALARMAEGFRETAAKVIPAGSARRAFWARFFSGSVAANVLSGNDAAARNEAQRLLNGETNENGFVWLIGAGPGAEDLLTLRAQRLLQEADIILHDQLVPEAVVGMGRRDAERIKVGKAKGAHSFTQEEINQLLVREATAGKRVVRLKSGDPMIFGRAGEEISVLRDAGIGYEIVPGVTAALAAAASAEIPLTLRGVASSLVFATGHDKDGETLPDWAGLALSGTTVAVYMGKTVAAGVAARLIDAGLDQTMPVMAIENAARADEAIYAGALSDLSGFSDRDEIGGPVLMIIGNVVAEAALERALPLKRTDVVDEEIPSSIAA
ncbi:MAG: siroheme synthase CysG [Stappiaceae bacterium]